VLAKLETEACFPWQNLKLKLVLPWQNLKLKLVLPWQNLKLKLVSKALFSAILITQHSSFGRKFYASPT
jgi:hypothetical protein